MKILFKSKKFKKILNYQQKNIKLIKMIILLLQKKDIKEKLVLMYLINTFNMEEVTVILF